MASKASRVTQRLKEAVGQSNSQHRCNDLAVAAQQYNAMRRNLSNLVKSLRNQHQALVALGKTRMEITRNISMMSARTPLYESTGKQANSENPSVCSYTTIQIAVGKNHEMLCDKFNQFVVSYAVEWERIVNTRISHSLKKAENLRRELDHYQQKVESLRQSLSVSMAKGKSVDPKAQDKLNRNEEKFAMSRKEYNEFASSLCLLIDEIVNRGWKDLHPLLVKMSQFDSTMSQSEANQLRSLNKIIDMLKVVGDKHDLKPEARLKELETLTAKQLYSGPEDAFVNANLIADEPFQKPLQPSYDQYSHGDQFSHGNQFSHGGPHPNSQNQNLLEMGGPHPPSSTDWSNPINNQMSSLSVNDHRAPPHQHRPPPPSSSQPFNNEFNLLDTSSAPAPAPSTRDMIDIASRSAPPPTFDMLNDNQSHKFHDDRRGYNAAPAPGAAPPPPPRQIGMYPANGDGGGGGGGGGYEPPRTNEQRGSGGAGGSRSGYDDYDAFDYSRTANGGTAGGGSSYNGGGYNQFDNAGPSRGGGDSYDQYFDNKGGPPPSRGDGPSYDRFNSYGSSEGGSYEPPSTSSQPPQRNDNYGFNSQPMGGSSMVPYDQDRGYGGGESMGGQRSASGGSNQNSFGGAMGGSAPGNSRQGQDWSSGPNPFGHGSASGPPVRPRPF